MNAHDQIKFELRERLKEIKCLNETTVLLGETVRDPEETLSAAIICIRAAFQFPERISAELILGEKSYQTPDYQQTTQFLREPVTLNRQIMGGLTVCYTGTEKAEFLPEERNLLRNLAQMVAYYQNRRESERQLRETIEQQEHRGTKLEALLDALPEMLFIFDKEGTIIDYHAGKSSDLAMPPELFLHHKLTELFPASLSNLFLGLIGNVIAEGKMASTEYAMDIAGKIQHYETRMSRYDNRLVIALVNNITDRVLTRERLTQSEEKYRSLVDSSDAIVLMIDDQGIILFANSIAAAFFGISMDEVSGKRLSDILPEKQARAYLDAAGAIIESGTGETYEQTMTSSEGPKWFHTSVQPVRGTDGKVFAVMINANEITAIKKAEQKLLRSERNYRSLFFNAPYAYLILRNGRILECNEATLRILDGERKQVIGHSILDFAPEYQPNGRRSDEYAAEITAIAMEKKNKRFEWMHVRLDESQFLAEVNLGVVEYDGEPVIITTWRDITQERKAEEDLRIFRTISDHANIGNAIASLEGELLYVNEEFAHMHGRTVDELLGKNLSILYSESQIGEVRKAHEHLHQDGEINARELWRLRLDGSVFPSLTSIKLLRAKNGTPQFMAASVIDISDLKHKETEIRKLNLAIEQSPVALVVTDLDGVITYVSPALTRITGYESSEVIGKKTSILKSGQTPPSTYQDLWATIKRGEIWKGEWVNKKKNGDLYTENVTISPVYDEQGKMINYIAVKEDVTLNRQVEKDRIAKTVAEEAN